MAMSATEHWWGRFFARRPDTPTVALDKPEEHERVLEARRALEAARRRAADKAAIEHAQNLAESFRASRDQLAAEIERALRGYPQ